MEVLSERKNNVSENNISDELGTGRSDELGTGRRHEC